MTDGVQEEAAAFKGVASPFAGLARYRTFGEEGPMYQVLEVRGDRVLVWLSNSDEEVEIPLASALQDPLAH
jgi:hypothetical protein